MPYNDQLKTVFLHIPKTGGTTIKRMLGIRQFNSENPELIPSPQHLTCALLRTKMGGEKYDSYFKFTFIRNPWSRLVSEYFWRQSGPKRRVDMTFSGFTEYAAGIALGGRFYERRFDDHFIPQIEYTRDVNRVYRFEQFAQGVMSVAKILGLDIEEVPAKPARQHDHYWEFYDPASRARVERVYQEDIDAFGYEFEG
jgi:chondroitin 4-sulfotransferase 11